MADARSTADASGSFGRHPILGRRRVKRDLGARPRATGIEKRPLTPGMIAAVRRGDQDIDRAAMLLASRIPAPLGLLARVAFNYRWSWLPGGPELFRSVDPHRWELCGENPVRLLEEASAEALARAAGDDDFLARAASLENTIRADLARPPAPGPLTPQAAGRLPLCRVRAAPLASDLLWRPRRPGGRLPQGGLGPRASLRGRRPHVPPGLLPPAPGCLGMATRVLGRHRPRAPSRSARERRGWAAADRPRPHARNGGDRPDLAGRRRAHSPLPPRR